MRAIAAASKSRIEPLPDLPTVAEAGYKDFDVAVWFGLVAPAMTPREIISQLADWFTAAMQAPEVTKKLRDRDSTRSGCAARILPRTFVNNMKTTAARYAKPTSRWNEKAVHK